MTLYSGKQKKRHHRGRKGGEIMKSQHGVLLPPEDCSLTPHAIHILHCCLLHHILFPVCRLSGNGSGFCGGQVRRAGAHSQPREQGKLQGSSPHVAITSYQCNGKTGSFGNGGTHGNPFLTEPSGSPVHLIKLLKKNNVVREENLAISAVVGLCGGCQSHMSEEAVPTSEMLQLIKDYTQWQLHFG